MAKNLHDDDPAEPRTRTSTPELLTDAMSHAASMVRGEMDLFRAEMQQSMNQAMAAVGMMITGLVLILVALNVFAAAFVAWLTQAGVGPGWSSIIVGGVLAILAVILLLVGKNKLKLVNLAPKRTAKNVQRDAHTVQEVRHGH
ncbi:phage holin family protein [Tranquillimonas alkanivorans]|uniref:Putative Holin-X, holin superfamily III n=1 Tax=Tranquillimonas alkanivorans TaxID=441119 RepID=A0A1I5WR58_9RHOB|nr:phage holin family protein [Tranquillimonas alkanivorans]SFQ22229.1 Putative Holin-X, holin superfamily III [Tranquillimonas alkanivorans]